MNRWIAASTFLCCVLGVLFGLGSYTFLYAKGFSYLSTAPEVCANCHIMQKQYDGWLKSSHHTAAVCADCHMPHDFFGKYWTKVKDGFKHSAAFTLQNFHEPIQIHEGDLRVLNYTCLHCHGEFVGHLGMQDVTTNGEPLCTKCHSEVGH